MSDDTTEDVTIFPPDKTMQVKIGYANLKLILTPQIIADAQQTIHKSADQFFKEGLMHLQQLEYAWANLKTSHEDPRPFMTTVINASFSLKTKSGLGGYDLASVLARSLQLHCECIPGEKPTGKNAEIIEWHIASLKKIVMEKIKGYGGEIGEAIREELKKFNQEMVS